VISILDARAQAAAETEDPSLADSIVDEPATPDERILQQDD